MRRRFKNVRSVTLRGRPMFSSGLSEAENDDEEVKFFF